MKHTAVWWIATFVLFRKLLIKSQFHERGIGIGALVKSACVFVPEVSTVNQSQMTAWKLRLMHQAQLLFVVAPELRCRSQYRHQGPIDVNRYLDFIGQ